MSFAEKLSDHRTALTLRANKCLSDREALHWRFGYSGIAIVCAVSASCPMFWHVFAEEKRVWRIRNPALVLRLTHTAMGLQLVAISLLIYNVTPYGPLAKVKVLDKHAEMCDSLVWDLATWRSQWDRRKSNNNIVAKKGKKEAVMSAADKATALKEEDDLKELAEVLSKRSEDLLS